MTMSGLTRWGILAALACGFVALLIGAERLAQPVGGDAARSSHAADASRNERLLTSDKPDNHRILNSLFKRLFGNPKCEKLSHAGSEVWTVPHSTLARLEERLLSLGIKFALLREDWNHILRPNKKPMSSEQKEALARAKESPAAVSAGVTSMMTFFACSALSWSGESGSILGTGGGKSGKGTDVASVWRISPLVVFG